MATVNTRSITVKMAQGYTDKVLQKAAQNRARQVFEDAVIGMQKEFEEHPVTQEIDGGISASNISDTLQGGSGPENLTSFIGFPEGSVPTQAIRQRLDPDHPDGPKLTYTGKTGPNTLNYKFKIKGPDKDAIYRDTPIPWASGLSWAKKIETGIPGFAKFLAKYMGDPSRSGGGVQIQNEIRSATYTPPAQGYLSTIFSNFFDRVKSYGKAGYRTLYQSK